MTPELYHAVQASYPRIEPHLDAVAQVFFQKLIRHAPDIRRQLPQDSAGRERLFADYLGYAVRNLHRRQSLSAMAGQSIGRLGLDARSVRYVPSVGMALIYAIKDRVPGGLTAKETGAWLEAFSFVSDIIVREMLDAAA